MQETEPVLYGTHPSWFLFDSVLIVILYVSFYCRFQFFIAIIYYAIIYFLLKLCMLK